MPGVFGAWPCGAGAVPEVPRIRESETVMAERVLMKIHCGGGHIAAEYKDVINEKYPFWCQACDDEGLDPDLRSGKYPWSLTSEIIDEPGHWQDTTSGRVFIKDES